MNMLTIHFFACVSYICVSQTLNPLKKVNPNVQFKTEHRYQSEFHLLDISIRLNSNSQIEGSIVRKDSRGALYLLYISV